MLNKIAIFAVLMFSSSIAIAAVSACKPTEVAAFYNRIHVRCAAPTLEGFWYFAVPTAGNDQNANRFLSLLNSAFISKHNINVYYTPSDSTGPGFGCLINDCRPLQGVQEL